MWRGEDRQAHTKGSLPVQEHHQQEAHGLPPRRLRHRQKRYPIPAVLGSGIALFGALFFGMVGLELYQAHRSPQAAVEVQAGQFPSEQPLSPAKTVQSKENPQTSAGRVSSLSKPSVSQPPDAKAAFAVKAVKGAANASAAKTASPPKQPSATPAKPRVLRHVVKKGETLYQLSRKYYGHQSGVKRIAHYNGFGTEHELLEGEVVYIPLIR
jgi:LysM repeat protein